MTILTGTTLMEGRAEAPVLALSEPLSFWGGLDSETGRIIDRRHPQSGTVMSGRILVMEAGRGSSSGSSVLAEAIRARTAPAGIILLRRDAIIITGALVASALYDVACPVVLASPEDWTTITAAAFLRIEAGPDKAQVFVSDLFEPAHRPSGPVGPILPPGTGMVQHDEATLTDLDLKAKARVSGVLASVIVEGDAAEDHADDDHDGLPGTRRDAAGRG